MDQILNKWVVLSAMNPGVLPGNNVNYPTT
uniref:Uncharacterized protein n=1 Tax=Vitis vinifera TaxID=29760 RepID=F6H9W5_VITVI